MTKIRYIMPILVFGVLAAEAEFSKAEVAGVMREYVAAGRVLHMQAHDLMRPMLDQVNEQKAQLRAPFQAEIEPLEVRIREFRSELEELNDACSQLRRTLPEYHQRFELVRKAEEEASARLRAELESCRAPIMPEIERLQGEYRKVENNYRHHKSQTYGKFMDWIDDEDCGFRLGAIEGQIKRLYESVGGDLSERIRQIESEARTRTETDLRAQEEKVNKSIAAISRCMQPIRTQLEELEAQVQTIYGAQQGILSELMPHTHLFGELQEDFEMGLLLGLPL